jgi:hypothetical protein
MARETTKEFGGTDLKHCGDGRKRYVPLPSVIDSAASSFPKDSSVHNDSIP